MVVASVALSSPVDEVCDAAVVVPVGSPVVGVASVLVGVVAMPVDPGVVVLAPEVVEPPSSPQAASNSAIEAMGVSPGRRCMASCNNHAWR
jgi:hypothetical protein